MATPFVPDANTPYLHQTSCFAQLQTEKAIATCEAYLIRGINRPDLWNNLANCGHEVTDLAYTLFDQNGHFREKFYHHSVAKGTGVWGTEINTGEILLIEIFKVSRAWRGKRIGTRLFQTFLAAINEQLSGGYFIFARPGILPDEEDRDHSENKIINLTEAFYRSLGFRRVGNSAWFGYAKDPNHASRHLKAALDLCISEPSSSSQWPAITQLMRTLANPRVSDDTSLQRLCHVFHDSSSHAQNDPQWEVQSNPEGDTLLHKAALACKPKTVKYILSLRPDLATRPNVIYYTALHVLEEAMEKLRHPFPSSSLDTPKPVTRPFKGYSTASLECYQILKSCSEQKEETLLSDDARLATLI
ncbi:hypothetical protein V8F33_010841 [Rhypophila sp. PSN 637]